jgi:cation diffusion facilitator CzcD-associated flavoprotein CzcO
MSPPDETLDVLIIGAGISGIGAAYHLQHACPGTRFAILEARDRLGGTWDLFRYPGIRSDSDMYTLGFSFRPWTNPQAIADGPSILAYLEETVREFGLDRHIRFGTRAVRVDWSSAEARWTVETTTTGGARRQLSCRFLFVCTGYYDYAEGYTPDFPGRDTFEGRIVHPQSWTPDIDYTAKRVVVIGSGATAITLVPELSRRAAHVTMLQRSPSYVMALPGRDPLSGWLRGKLSDKRAYDLVRWKNALLFIAFFAWCRKFPSKAKAFLLREARKRVPSLPDFETHFTPRYNPWEQRLCFAPDGDFFAPLRDGRASIVTDRIERFTPTGILLASGRELPADLIVTATGLKLQLFGGVAVTVDGAKVKASDRLVYKGMMLSDVPNLAFAIGYTNASWTLKVDLVAAYVCRLLQHMDQHGYRSCVPRLRPDDRQRGTRPLIDFSSGYVERAVDGLPKQGAVAPWRLYQNYVLDRTSLHHAPVTDEVMRFG